MATVGAILRGKPRFCGVLPGSRRGFKVPSPAFRRCPKIRYLACLPSAFRAFFVRSPENRCPSEARCSTAGARVGSALLGPVLALAMAGCSGAIVSRLAETCPQVCRGSGMEQCGPVLVSTANLETFCSCCQPDAGPSPRQDGGWR